MTNMEVWSTFDLFGWFKREVQSSLADPDSSTSIGSLALHRHEHVRWVYDWAVRSPAGYNKRSAT